MAKSQLVMVRRELDTLPPLFQVPQFALREMRDSDHESVAETLSDAFDAPWTIDRVRSEFVENDYVLKTFVITHGECAVATASAAFDQKGDPRTGTLHWVGALRTHRGRRLGELVSLAVLHEFRSRGFLRVDLLTDDDRLPAIKTYLNLGFEPELIDASHEERWRVVQRTLATWAI